MRWIPKYTRPEIETGTTRLKRVFAWVPKYIDGTVCWLEYYDVLQAYVKFEYIVNIDGQPKKFTVVQWVDVSERLRDKNSKN